MPQSIELPLAPCVRRIGLALILTCCLVIVATPIAAPWRIVAVVGSLAIGGLLWRRYRRYRPTSLCIDAKHRLRCGLESGDHIQVRQLHLGVIHPLLVSAHLEGEDGTRSDLFAPACMLSDDDHWRLRRALIDWRPDPSEGDGRQDSAGRGT